MHVDRRTERICPFPAAALPTRVQMIKFGDKVEIKSMGVESMIFPLFLYKKSQLQS